MKRPQDIGQEIIHGGGEMGKVVRAKDWSKTPLGPIESWPQSLRTTVNLCLASNFPISLAWGPQRVQIYNDGYWPICAAKHPHSMGQDFKECWLSAWPAIGEVFERASAGETAFLENRRMFLDRNGYLEETFFTFSFSPIRDETGAVGGLFHPVTEMTQQTLAERRLKVLRDVADATTDATSVGETMKLVAQALARHELDVPFMLLYRLDAKGQQARLAEWAGLPQGGAASPLLVNLESASTCTWPLAEAMQPAQSVLVENLEGRLGVPKCGPYPELPKQAFVLPLNVPTQERPLALLVAGASARRPMDAPYRTFYEMLGTAVTNALSKASAYEQERRRAEALAELDRAKTTFFSNVSHEFRTPLTLLLGPLEEELRRNPDSRERLEVAHRNSLRLLKLVNTLLDFSRLEAGRLDAAYEPTDLCAFTTDLASIFRSAVEQAGLRLSVDCGPLAEPVYVDREMWEKIVLNLLSNAFKFTFQGEIRVGLRQAGERVELSVSDTGVGIPEAELPRVFERFHRVRGARARSHEGTGIGLALVHELARLHGGEVKVHSQEGQGTTFTVALPTGTTHLPPERIRARQTFAPTAVAAMPFVEEALHWLPEGVQTAECRMQNEADAASGEPRLPSALPTTQPTILLADDNADMRGYLCHLLRQRYQVIAVRDGEAALAAAREDKVDLVLSDVMMPRLDGFALLRALRQEPATRGLPVILLSARAGEEARVEGLEAGADDYLAKPFSARELLARIEVNLHLAQIRREAEAAVRASEVRYRRLFEAARDGVLLMDPQTLQITDANPFMTEILGYSREELVGKELWQIGLLQDAEASRAAFEQLREQGYIRYEDLPLQTQNGQTREVEFVSNLYQEDGRFVIQCNIRDISERKRLEAERAALLAREQAARREAENAMKELQQVNERLRASEEHLRAANRELDDFATIVSHDLKAPLRGVATLAKWLQSDYADKLDEEGRENLADMAKRVGRMDRMIDGILQYSRLGRIKEKPEPTALAELVPAVVEDLAPPPHARVWVAPGLPVVHGEPVRLRQLFQNLIGNAIKYGDKAQMEIRVKWSERDSEWEFCVADNGPGIEERHFEKIFKIFQTLAPKDRTDSTGVGLALVKRIVERAAGRVWLESQLGQGTTFHFTWPKTRRGDTGTQGKGDAETGRDGEKERMAA